MSDNEEQNIAVHFCQGLFRVSGFEALLIHSPVFKMRKEKQNWNIAKRVFVQIHRHVDEMSSEESAVLRQHETATDVPCFHHTTTLF